MRKEVQFTARFDNAEFDRSIEQMQRKLREMYSSSDMVRMQQSTAGRMEGMGLGGSMSKPTQEAYQRATQQSRREMDQYLVKEVQQQDRLYKIIEKRESKIKDLKKLQDDMLRGSKQELEVKEKISRMEENNFRLRETYRARDQQINQTMEARESLRPQGIDRLSTAYKNGGIGGAATAAGRMIGGMGPAGILGMVGGGLGALAGVAQIGGNVYANYKGAPLSTQVNQGSAMQGVYGREVQAAYSGRTPFEMAFLPEKQRAFALAHEAMAGQRVKNVTDLIGSPLQGGMSATLKGAGFGAGVGSVIPGIGTALGAGIGGAIGFGANAISNVATNPKAMSLLGSPFSNTMNQNYESMMAKEFAGKYSEALQGLKEDNPMKTAAAGEYQQNFGRNLNFQRSLGLNYGSFHGAGGFRENAINAGFTDEMAMGASGQILGAGGSTRMGRDSVFALQAARSKDITNSGQILGSLSGGLGSSESSKQAFVKIFAEGTKLGLDSSEYREENRKFMEATANIVAGSGVTSQDDIQRLVSQFGGFMSDKTTRGMEAGKNAFDFYNQASSETSGPRGVLRAAAFQKDPLLSKMTPMDRATLAQIPADQLSETDDAVIAIARRNGVSPKDVISSVLGANKQSFSITSTGDNAKKKAISLKEELSKMGNSPGLEGKRQELQNQIQEQEQNYSASIAFENPNMNVRTRKALTKFGTSFGGAEQNQSFAEYQKQLESDKSVRPEDETVKGMAEGSRMVLENFRKFKDDLVPAASAVKEFNEQLNKTVEIMMKLPASERNKYFTDMGFLGPKTQDQSGKSSK